MSGLVPKLRLPEFCDSPKWELTTIGNLARQVVAGGTPETTKPEYWNGDIRWMSSGELNLKRVSEVQGRISEAGLRNSSTRIIPKRSILIGLAGQGKTRGTVAMNLVELCTNQSIAAVLPNGQVFSEEFLYHELDRRYDELRRLSAGGEGRGGLNLQIIKSLRLLLPSLPEQRKIAECLTSLDELIAAEGQRLEALRKWKKALLQNLFPREGETTPRLRFPEFRTAGEWEETTIGANSHTFSGGTPDTKTPEFYGGPIPFIRSAEIGSETTELLLSADGLKNSSAKLVEVGDVLLALYGANSGDCALARTAGAINQAVLCIRPSGSKPFLHHFLVSRKDWIVAKYLQGGQGNLSAEIVKSIPFPTPKEPEQHRIASCLGSLDALITGQAKKLDTLKTHKQGLMQGLFPSPESKDA